MEGTIFGRLTVTRFSHTDERWRKYWVCVCTCGVEKVIRYDALKAGIVQSCGCLRKETTRKNQKRSVEVRKNTGFRTYTSSSHRAMIRRCHVPTTLSYCRYGAKGITVCDRWRFGEGGKTGAMCFYEDMGPRPQGYTIDRIDNTKGYEPSNCRWATPKEQAKNRR